MSVSIFNYLNDDEIREVNVFQTKHPQAMMHLTDYISALAFEQVRKALKNTIEENAKSTAPIVKGGEKNV